mmetsp:Transcript_39007/g.117822  ORF Transcript_39007/g.117822 Transcript_39007/m.117822 type:complete len:333 (+) Transcript_39007:317-1315(+)
MRGIRLAPPTAGANRTADQISKCKRPPGKAKRRLPGRTGRPIITPSAKGCLARRTAGYAARCGALTICGANLPNRRRTWLSTWSWSSAVVDLVVELGRLSLRAFRCGRVWKRNTACNRAKQGTQLSATQTPASKKPSKKSRKKRHECAHKRQASWSGAKAQQFGLRAATPSATSNKYLKAMNFWKIMHIDVVVRHSIKLNSKNVTQAPTNPNNTCDGTVASLPWLHPAMGAARRHRTMWANGGVTANRAWAQANDGSKGPTGAITKTKAVEQHAASKRVEGQRSQSADTCRRTCCWRSAQATQEAPGSAPRGAHIQAAQLFRSCIAQRGLSN